MQTPLTKQSYLQEFILKIKYRYMNVYKEIILLAKNLGKLGLLSV